MTKTVNLNNALNLAQQYISDKEFTRAINLLQEIAPQAPNVASVYLLLFNCYAQKKDTSNAVSAIETALSIDDSHSEHHLAYLKFLYFNQDYERGRQHGSSIKDKFSDKHLFNIIGLLYRETGDFITAAEYFSKAVSLDEKFLEPMHNMVHIYTQTGQVDDAIKILNKCLANHPDYQPLYTDLAANYLVKGMLKNAISIIEKGYKLFPNNEEIIAMYIQVARYACLWDKVNELTPIFNEKINTAITHENLAPERPWLNVTRVQNSAFNLAVAENSVKYYIQPRVEKIQCDFTFSPKPNSKIRLGFFTDDFYDHAISHLLGNMQAYLNREQFEVIALSYAPIKDDDEFQKAIKTSVDKYLEIKPEGFKPIAEFIYQQNIDILIDMKGYTKGAMLEVCALKPAPVLIQYLGYPGTMGSSRYDYIVTDEVITPLSDEQYYSEKFIYMPHTYQVTHNTQKIAEPFTRQHFGLPESAVILGAFNNSFKIEEDCFQLWLDILKQQNNTILWLYEANDFLKNHLLEYAKNYNQTDSKIIFTGKLPKEQHLARLQIADLLLDTFTCNGHTTTSDGLWAGVPVITLQGKHFCSRVSSSILTAMGLDELITSTEDEYKNSILTYCKDHNKLSELKQKVISQRNSSALFNTQQYAEDFGKAMLKVYQRYREGLAPEHVWVD